MKYYDYSQNTGKIIREILTVFARFNLKVVFPPPYEREVWHFKKANIDHVRKVINGFQWEKSFQNMNANDMVHEIHLGLIVQ